MLFAIVVLKYLSDFSVEIHQGVDLIFIISLYNKDGTSFKVLKITYLQNILT